MHARILYKRCVGLSTKILSYIPYNVIYENDSALEAGREKVVQNGMNGCKSITYKILKLNGQQISSTVLSTDTYDPMNKIIKRGPEKVVQTNTAPQEQTPIETPTIENPEALVPEEPAPEEQRPDVPGKPPRLQDRQGQQEELHRFLRLQEPVLQQL